MIMMVWFLPVLCVVLFGLGAASSSTEGSADNAVVIGTTDQAGLGG